MSEQNGLGKTAALYNYPYEHHGPATRETILDLWARWISWLDMYVKNPEKGKEKAKKKITTRTNNKSMNVATGQWQWRRVNGRGAGPLACRIVPLLLIGDGSLTRRHIVNLIDTGGEFPSEWEPVQVR